MVTNILFHFVLDHGMLATLGIVAFCASIPTAEAFSLGLGYFDATMHTAWIIRRAFNERVFLGFFGGLRSGHGLIKVTQLWEV